MSVTVTKSGSGGLAKLAANLKRIQKSDVLVGIPSSGSSRGTANGINNAEALWIFSNGSPLNNQPPRPVLEPAIEKNQAKISPHLGLAAQAVLRGDPDAAQKHLQMAGVIASNGAKRMFSLGQNDWAANAPSTIAAKGSDVPGIDTGSMRRALTYVVRDDGTEKVRGPELPEGSTGEAAVEGAGAEAGELAEVGEVAEAVAPELLLL